MNKNYLFAIMTMAALAACSGDDLGEREQSIAPGTRINFSVTADESTRGTRIGSAADISSFGVTAIKAPKAATDEQLAQLTPDFFYNLPATRNANDVFDITQDYYWPTADEKLFFYAYTPFATNGNANGIVLSESSTPGPQRITFTASSDVESQVDFMTAYSPTTSFTTVSGAAKKAAVPMAFTHELTAIRFVIGEQWLEGKIKSVAIKNVHGKGTLTVGTHDWEWVDENNQALTATDNFVYTINKTGVEGTDGEEFLDLSQYFLMIPQTFDGESPALLEIVYQDNTYDYTVTSSLANSVWERNKTIVYTLSSHELTKLRVGTLGYPTTPAGAPRTTWQNGDQVGLYVVKSAEGNGKELRYTNIPVTYQNGSWSVDHTTDQGVVYQLSGDSYYFYYPYRATPTGYPIDGNKKDATADEFFSQVIDAKTVQENQSDINNFLDSDLQVAKGTHDADIASTINATMKRKVGLANIILGSDQAKKLVTYTNNDAGTVNETGNVVATSSFSNRIPFNNSSNGYFAYIKAGVSTSFGSSTTAKDAWEDNLNFTVPAGADDWSQTQTAHSDRRNWDYVNAIWNYSYTSDNYYTWTPAAQSTYNYTIECWGAQGGNYNSTYQGGKGGYTKGTISLNTTLASHLYVYTGQHPSDQSLTAGWNGGGAGTSKANSDGLQTGYGGGGATDIRLVSGDWNDFTSLKSRIMVAGAGGATGYWIHDVTQCGIAGYGGGISGGGGTDSQSDRGTYYSGSGASQTDGGNANSTESGLNASGVNKGGFGYGGTNGYTVLGGCAGGGGYYGGGASNRAHGGGGGGSSFISGYTGCNAVGSNATADDRHHTGQPNHYSGLVFSNTEMKAGNATQTAPGGGSETGHSGHGYCRITLTRW